MKWLNTFLILLMLGMLIGLKIEVGPEPPPAPEPAVKAACPEVLVKDCEFSDCTFRSIYEYQADVRALLVDRALDSAE